MAIAGQLVGQVIGERLLVADAADLILAQAGAGVVGGVAGIIAGA
jgi:hypothetical protein